MAWQHALLGFAVAASFGPINLLLTKRALFGHVRIAAAFAGGASIGDLVLLTIGLTAAQLIADITSGTIASALNLVAGVLLVLIACRSLMVASGRITVAIRESIEGSPSKQAMLALGLTISSPLGVALWLSVSSFIERTSESTFAARSFALVTTMLGDIAWFVLWTSILVLLRRQLKLTHLRLIGMLADVIVAGFGLVLVVRALF